MSSDDQHFLDMLSAIPNDVKKYSLEIADAIDRQIDEVAALLRDSLSNQAWLPQSIKPPPPPPSRAYGPPPTLVQRAQDWILAHRAWTAAFVGFMGTGGLLIYRQRRLYGKKRKARKAGNGARKEIVVIASSPHEPMARSIAHDLERRGFIVFVTVTSPEEEQLVRAERKGDIRPLYIDITSSTPSPSDLHPSLREIHSLLTVPQHPTASAQAHTCHFSSLILLPSPSYPNGPLSAIPPSTWADTVNTRLLTPVLTTQLFLPLFTYNKNKGNTIVLLTPSIPSSLAAPFNSPEVLVTRGLEGWASSLRQELIFATNGSPNIDVVQLKLGHIDLEPSYYRNTSTELLTWEHSQRAQHGSPRRSPAGRQSAPSPSSSSIDFHNAVFDAVAMNTKPTRMFGKRRQVVHVGKGSWAYSMVGRWVPGGIVGWMLGFGARPGVWRNGEDSGSEVWEKV